MKSKRSNRNSRRQGRVRSTVAARRPISQPFRKSRRLPDVPGVDAIVKRARSPYVNNPLTEDEALNLIRDARADEPTYPIEKLLGKSHHKLGD